MQLRQSPSMVFRLLDPIPPAKHQPFLSTLIFFIGVTQSYLSLNFPQDPVEFII